MIGAVDPEQGTGGGGSENVVLEGEGDRVSSCDCSQATQTVKASGARTLDGSTSALPVPSQSSSSFVLSPSRLVYGFLSVQP